MGRNIPILNRDIEWCKEWLEKNTSSPMVQKKLVLVVVSIALLLDNMLYMVIVPIIPRYLREIHAYEVEYVGYHNETRRLKNGTIVVKMIGGQIDYLDEEIELGWLFASKALLQIFVNPFSGFIIDRIGYELPMIIGLVVMFSSTAIFALGRSYGVLFFARSLQGFGSAFADTSADRFTEENERAAALGVALAFISFGCLVAPPFGSILYSFAGKPVPFLILALICLLDAFMVFMVIQQKPHPVTRASNSADPSEKATGTPMWRLFMDPFIAICSGALIMANISLAFLEPTITTWMDIRFTQFIDAATFRRHSVFKDHAWHTEVDGWIDMVRKNRINSATMLKVPENFLLSITLNVVTELMSVLFRLPPFFPHVLGVYVTVQLLKRFPQKPWFLALIGLAMEGVSCAFLPFMKSIALLILPLSTICFGIALIDTSVLPLLAYLVDTRHVGVYGSVFAIADVSYSLAYAFGPIIAGGIVNSMGFKTLNIIICVLNLAYLPVLYMLRKVYAYEQLDGQATTAPTAAIPPPTNNGTVTQPLNNQNYGLDAEKPKNPFGGFTASDSYQNAAPANNAFDPLNPQW